MSLRLVWRPSRSKGKRQSEKGSWYIRGTDHTGKRVNDSLHTGDRHLANREFAKRVAKTLEERVSGPKALANFADACELYYARGENTNKQWLELMCRHEWFGRKLLCEMTQGDIDRLAREMYPNCSAATRKRQVYTPFLAAWNACVKHTPPLADPRPWQSPRVKRKTVDAPDDGYIATLVESVKAAVRRDGGRFGRGSLKPERDVAAVLFLTFTGCRSGEARLVRLKDVDLDRAYALLRKTKGKNDNPRQVALAPDLVDALRTYIATLPADTPGDFVLFQFESRFGLPQMVARVRRRAGLPHYRPHAIGRHAFATRLLHDGKSLLDVQKAGGWSSGQMVTQTYGHLAQEHVDRVVSEQRLKPKPLRKKEAG